jgi:hypothetical protein
VSKAPKVAVALVLVAGAVLIMVVYWQGRDSTDGAEALVAQSQAVVSERLEAKVRADFSAATAEPALRRLAALKLVMAEQQNRERIQAAIVLLASGDPEKLEHYASVAEVDWRDVLFWSGLGDEGWPSRLDEELGPA